MQNNEILTDKSHRFIYKKKKTKQNSNQTRTRKIESDIEKSQLGKKSR